MEPETLARELGITGKTLRSWLRRTYPRHPGLKGAPWELRTDQVAAARAHFGGGTHLEFQLPPAQQPRADAPRRSRDEEYVVNLCDEILGERARRQHRFPWLLGDAGSSGRRATLPVDAHYPKAGIVFEYRERQHTEAVKFFDKPDRLTVSGVDRGEQRRIYDRRREELIPEHGLTLVIVHADELDADRSGRLRRSRASDLQVLRQALNRGDAAAAEN